MDTTALTLPEEQIRLLSKPTPKEFISQRPGAGGRTFSYVDIGYVTGRLNHIFGSMWSFEVKDKGIDTQYGQVWVLGALKVLCADGKVITKENFGSSVIKQTKDKNPISFGDDLKSASSDALKKCASMLGLAADVYFPKTWKLVEKMRPGIKAMPQEDGSEHHDPLGDEE